MAENTSQAVEEARRRALEAMAQQGQAGVDALRAGQMQVAATQQQAVDTALAGSIARGAPAGAADDLTAIISEPGSIAQQTLAGAAARAQADQAAMTGATASYFDQAAAGVPVMQAAIDRELAAGAAAANQQLASQAAAAQAQAEANARRAAEAGAAAASEQDFRYGGYDTAGEYENAATALAQELQAQALAEAQVASQRASQRATVARHNPDSFVSPPGHPVPSTRPAPVQTPTLVDAIRGDMAHADTLGQVVGGVPQQQDRPRQTYTPAPTLPYRALDNRTEQAVLAREAGRVVGDPANLYQFQREAAINYLGGDPLDAQGRFLAPDPADLADRESDAYEQQIGAQEQALERSFIDSFGVAPTGREQLQRFALGEDPFRGGDDRDPVQEAGRRVGLPEQDVESLRQLPAYSGALTVVESLLEEAKAEGFVVTRPLVQEALATLYQDYGHDYPKVTELVLALYADKIR